MSDLFCELGLNQSLCNALLIQNISMPTDVQIAVIPEVLLNKNIIVQAETGTGKTLAYLLPLFEVIKLRENNMLVLIVTPTHELAMQIHGQIELLSKNADANITSASIIGNVNIDRQVEKLKQKPQLIVGTTGRVLELIQKRKIPAHLIKTLVIDESDKLLEKNNIVTINSIIKSLSKDTQILMFSALMPAITLKIAKEIAKESKIIFVNKETKIPTAINHLCLICEERDKLETLRKLIGILKPSRAFVFINKNNEIEIANQKLNYHGIKSEFILSLNSKINRQKALEDFKKGNVNILISSDLTARGVHVDNVSHIFNISMPENSNEYLHRVGRTGRNGEFGVAISLVTENELSLIKMYEKELKIKINIKSMLNGNIIDYKLKSKGKV